MKHIRLLAAFASVLLSPLAWAQDAPKKPPPLQEIHSAADREYFSFAFSPDARFLAAGAAGSVRLLYEAGGKFTEAGVLNQKGRVDDLIFDPAVKILISRSRDQDALVWDTDGWAPLKFATEDLTGGGLALRAGAQKAREEVCSCAVLSNRTRGLRLWMTNGLRRKSRSVAQVDVRDWADVSLGHVTAVAWDGAALLAGDDQGYLYRLPDARKLVEKLDDSTVVLGKIAQSPANAHVFQPHLGEVTAIGLAAKARRCVTAGMDGKVRLWDLEKIAPMAPGRKAAIIAPEWEIAGQAAELSADGKYLAVADADGVGVYQAASGVALSWNPTRVAGGRVVRLRFDADGKHLAGILCRCTECGQGGAIEVVRPHRRMSDHGGVLVIWK